MDSHKIFYGFFCGTCVHERDFHEKELKTDFSFFLLSPACLLACLELSGVFKFSSTMPIEPSMFEPSFGWQVIWAGQFNG